MSSSSDQSQPVVCPHCQTPLEPRSQSDAAGLQHRECPHCGQPLLPLADSPVTPAPASPFDDLFDDRGTPNWGKPLGPAKREDAAETPVLEQPAAAPLAADRLAAEEPLTFPDQVDPFATEQEPALEPLEGESKELFDFGTAGLPTESIPTVFVQPEAGTSQPEASAPELPAVWGDGQSPEALPLDPVAGEKPRPADRPADFKGTGRVEDGDAPLRIEGLESEGAADKLAGVRCRICDSLIYVRPSELGGKVKCPECYSEIQAELAAPRRSSTSGFSPVPPGGYVMSMDPLNSPKAGAEDDEYRLSEPVERPKSEIPSHYGLEPDNSDRLTPLPPASTCSVEAGNQAPAKTQAAAQTQAQAQSQSPAKKPLREAAEQAARQPAPNAERWKNQPGNPPRSAEAQGNGTPAPAPAPSQSKPTGGKTTTGLPPYWQQKPARPEPEVAEEAGTRIEMSLDEFAVPGPAITRWLKPLATDSGLWISFGLATLLLGLGYWCFELVGNWLSQAGDRKFWAILNSVLVGIPGGLAFFSGSVLTAIVFAVLFQLGVGKQPRLSDWKGYSFNELAPAVGFVAFALALAALPGALLGILLAVLSGVTLLIPIFAALSAALLAPLLLASAVYSDSPFRIFDSRVLRQISFNDVGWLRFLPGSLGGFGLFLLGTLLLLLSGLFSSTLGAAFQVAGGAIFGSLTGLYSGLLMEKINSQENQP